MELVDTVDLKSILLQVSIGSSPIVSKYIKNFSKRNFMQFNLIKITIQELLRYGLHIGYSRQYLNSQIKPYLVGFRGDFNIFNLKPVKYQLKALLHLITNLSSYRHSILVVNHYKEALSLNPILRTKRCFLVEGF